jgi:hypothetical protein
MTRPEKVQLLREKKPAWRAHQCRPLQSSLPFYERDGAGYVHRVRSAKLHYDDDGTHTHTSVQFWCGANGFLYPSGTQNPKHRPAVLTAQPTAGRAICATCQGRAIGAGQVGSHKSRGVMTRFKPHVEFFAPARRA